MPTRLLTASLLLVVPITAGCARARADNNAASTESVVDGNLYRRYRRM
jgi:hypothetical protein